MEDAKPQSNNEPSRPHTDSDEDATEQLKTQVKDLEQKAQEYLDGWKRAKADFINYKKEQDHTFQEFVKFANQNILLQILPVLDNFHIAIKHLPKDLEGNEWVKGILHIKTQLEDILKSQGLEEIKITRGELLDPQLHEVVGGQVGGDSIVEEVQKGYTLHGKVIKVAKVKVEVRKFTI